VIILHHGRLIRACDINEPDDGVGSVLRLRASIAMKERQLLPALRGLPCVRRVKVLPSMDAEISEVLLECDRMVSEGGDAQTQLFHLLCALDAPLRMLRP